MFIWLSRIDLKFLTPIPRSFQDRIQIASGWWNDKAPTQSSRQYVLLSIHSSHNWWLPSAWKTFRSFDVFWNNKKRYIPRALMFLDIYTHYSPSKWSTLRTDVYTVCGVLFTFLITSKWLVSRSCFNTAVQIVPVHFLLSERAVSVRRVAIPKALKLLALPTLACILNAVHIACLFSDRHQHRCLYCRLVSRLKCFL